MPKARIAPVLVVEPERFQPRKVAQVAALLRAGGVVAYPTDTVYAIGASAFEKRAIDRVYKIRGFDRGHPLAFVCPDVASIARYAAVSDFAYRWLKRLLPGPYTVILPATRELPRILREKRRSIGVRVPDYPLLQAVVNELGCPMIGTSAATPQHDATFQDAAEIRVQLGSQVDLVVDGGLLGIEPSTVVSLIDDQIEIVREGKGPVEELVG